MKSAQYHNKVKRAHALTEIKNNLQELHPTAGFNKEKIKSKIDGICSPYMKKLNEIKNSEASGVDFEFFMEGTSRGPKVP